MHLNWVLAASKMLALPGFCTLLQRKEL